MHNIKDYPPGLLGLPNAAFTDTSGDKDSRISGIDGWEIFKEIIISANANYFGLMLAWSTQLAGNVLGYQVLIGCLAFVGAGFLCWAVYRFFSGKERYKAKVTWRLFDWGLGWVAMMLVHYVF